MPVTKGTTRQIYRLSDGARIGEFVGDSLATDASGGIVAALHREDEIVVIDEHTGKELRRITPGSRVLLAHIVGSKERELLILTADQVAHRLPLSQSN